MFSSNNHSSNGGSKGKRLSSFFQFGGNNNTGNVVSQSTVIKNGISNTKGSVRPNGSKTSIKKTEDRKAASGKRNPFVPSSKLTTVATDVKNKRSSSYLTSQESSPHRDNLCLRSISEKTESSSHRHTSQTGSLHSHKNATKSTDVKKRTTSSSLAGKEDKEKSSSSSSSKHDSNGPSKRTSSLGRRPPPPVDLSILRNSMKQMSEDKQENIGLNTGNEWPDENLAISANVIIKGSPQSVLLQEGIVENTGNEVNLEQHKEEVSETEKFEKELDTLIREHNTVGGIQTAQYEEVLGHKKDAQNVLDTNLDFIGASNDENESPFSYVDPLKVSERPHNEKLPTAPLSRASPTESACGTCTRHSSSSPKSILPPVPNSLETLRSERPLNSSPIPPPVSSPIPPMPPPTSSPMPPPTSSPMPPPASSPMPPPASSPMPPPASSPMPPPASSPMPPPTSSPMPPPTSSPMPPPDSSPMPPPASSPMSPAVSSPVPVPLSSSIQPPIPPPISLSKDQVESSFTLQSYTLPSLEVKKNKSGTFESPFDSISFTGSEPTEGTSFAKSLSNDAIQDIQQGALDDTRDASSIVSSTLFHGDSLHFLTSSDSGNKTPPNATLHASPSMNNSSNQHGEKDRSEDYEDIDGRISKNPFLNSSVMERVANIEPKTIDSDDGSSNRVFDQVSGTQSLDTEVVILPRRKFRVVNEDRPTFYMDDFDGSLNDDAEYDDTARSHDGVNSKGLSVEASERSSTFIPVNLSNQNLESATPSAGMPSEFASLDSGASEDDLSKNTANSSKSKEGLLALGHNNLYSHQSLRSNKSNGSSNSTNSSGSVRHDKSVRLVSSYVEELRLKYYRSSNFLQAPPNLPITLKQKNNMVQSKNVKVRIRTSSKQIGIKHGGAKQKLLTLETAHEDVGEDGSMKTPTNKNRINVNHTREFQNLLSQKGSPSRTLARIGSPPKISNKDNDEIEEFMNDIPGDDAYDSDDAMAPLRKETAVSGVTRSNTVKSYFTKQQEKLQDINNASKYEKLPSNININDYMSSTQLSKTMSSESGDSGVNGSFSYGQELRIANPDSSSG